MLLENFQDYLANTQLLPPKSKNIVAVSGGVDSVTLLHLLMQLQSYYNWQLAIAHINHNQRTDSVADAELVADLAHKYDLPFYMHKLSKKPLSEAKLRKQRYDYLKNLQEELKFDRVIVAHHNDDRLETAIFNTIRGADRKGITAMNTKRDYIIRPLLPFSKAELITYAQINELPYNEDVSNEDLQFSRNYVRHQLLPLGSEMFRDFRHVFTKDLNLLSELNGRIDTQLAYLLENIATKNADEIIVNLKNFKRLPKTVQKEVLVFAVKKVLPPISLSKSNINEMLKFVYSQNTGSSMHLKNNLHLLLGYDTVKITCKPGVKDETTNSTVLLSNSNPFQNETFTVRVTDTFDEVDGVRLKPQKLFVRNWLAGDKMRPLGLKGSKKLQDIFVDKKVPRHLRQNWPVVVNQSGEIIWLPRLAVNEDHLAEDKSKDAVLLVCEAKL